MTCEVRSTIDRRPCSSLWQLAWTSVSHTDRYASEALFATMRYINWHWHLHLHQWILFIITSMDDYAEENRTEFNCIRSSESEAEVTNNGRLHWTYCTVLLKLLTDTKHRAASLREQSYLSLELLIAVAADFSNCWYRLRLRRDSVRHHRHSHIAARCCNCRLARCCLQPTQNVFHVSPLIRCVNFYLHQSGRYEIGTVLFACHSVIFFACRITEELISRLH